MSLASWVQPSQRLDRYILVERIGRGGMAEVFRAKLQSLGGFEREVALKVLLPQFANEPEFVDMLIDEARIAGAIDHPCVVQVLDVGRQGEIFYLVMEYVRGADLRSIARGRPGARLPLGMSLYVVGELLRGLAAVHDAVDGQGEPRRIVHRDVSPANVLVDERGVVKLGDFGIAHASGRLTRTRTGSVKGKSRYMAPEQLSGLPVDHRADLYAVGVTLFEALLGDEARDSSRSSAYGPVFTWPRHLDTERVPADVQALLGGAVTDEARHRFADAHAFRQVVLESLHRHAPGYDGESLARDMRRLRGLDVDSDERTVASRRAGRDELPSDMQAVPPAYAADAPRPTADTQLPTLPSVMYELFDDDGRQQPPTQPLDRLPTATGLDRLPTATQLEPLPPALGLDHAPTQLGLDHAPTQLGLDRGPTVAASPHARRPLARALAFVRARLGPRPRRVLVPVALGLVSAVAILSVVAAGERASDRPAERGPRALPSPAAPTNAAPAPTPPTTPQPSVEQPPRTTRPASVVATGTLRVSQPAGARVIIGATQYEAPCDVELLPGSYQVKLEVKKRVFFRRVSIAAGRITVL